MKKHFLRLIQVSLIIAIGGWFIGGAVQAPPVAAQSGELDAILARAVVKGYFISLKRDASGSPNLETFYLTEAAAQSEVAQELNQMGVAGYEINEESVKNAGGYQITATLEPESYVLTADVSKVANRWQIVSMTWVAGPPDMAMMADDTETTMSTDEADTTEATADEDTANDTTTAESETADTPESNNDDTDTDTTADADAENAATDDAASDTPSDDSTETAASDSDSTNTMTDDENTDATTADDVASDTDTETADTTASTDDTAATDDATTAADTSDTAANTATANDPAIAEVISVALNVRTGPGFAAEVASTLQQGDVVEITGMVVIDERPWYRVVQDGVTLGWISGKPQYVVTSGDAASIPTLSEADLDASTASDTVAQPLETPAETLANATESTPTETTPAEPAVAEASTETATSGVQATAEVLSVALNVRTGPGFEYEIVARLRQGEVVPVVGQNVTDGRPWYQISRNGSVLGWISAKAPYIRSAGDTESIPTVPAPEISSSTTAAPTTAAVVASQTPNRSISGEKLILQNRSGGDIYLINAARTEATKLTSGIDPALSPDGTKLAFTRWSSGGAGALWMYDFNTGAEAQILGEILQAKSPTWSADGSHIIVSYQEGGRREVERHCHKLGERKVPRGAFDISVDSQGKQICYHLRPDTHWKLRNIDVNARTYQDMASDIYSRSPNWDPVESWRVVFDGERGLKQLDVNRNVVLPMIDDPRDQGPVFSPDGNQIAVTYSQHQHWEVYTIDVPSGNRNRLTKTPILGEPYNSAAPAWSPDGRQIAFITDRTGQWEYWIMNADGSNPRPLLSPELSTTLSPEYNSVDERLITWGG